MLLVGWRALDRAGEGAGENPPGRESRQPLWRGHWVPLGAHCPPPYPRLDLFSDSSALPSYGLLSASTCPFMKFLSLGEFFEREALWARALTIQRSIPLGSVAEVCTCLCGPGERWQGHTRLLMLLTSGSGNLYSFRVVVFHCFSEWLF